MGVPDYFGRKWAFWGGSDLASTLRTYLKQHKVPRNRTPLFANGTDAVADRQCLRTQRLFLISSRAEHEIGVSFASAPIALPSAESAARTQEGRPRSKRRPRARCCTEAQELRHLIETLSEVSQSPSRSIEVMVWVRNIFPILTRMSTKELVLVLGSAWSISRLGLSPRATTED